MVNKWTPIIKPYIYGYELTIGGKKVEVMRAFAGEWLWFAYVNGVMVRSREDQPYLSYAKALKAAREFVTSKD